MAATRRDVFKTSVVSALGLMVGTEAAKAADFGATKVIVRVKSMVDNLDYDMLIDASVSPPAASLLQADNIKSGTVLRPVLAGTAAPAGMYVVAGSSPQATLTVAPSGISYNISANAWNEIGHRAHSCPTVVGHP